MTDRLRPDVPRARRTVRAENCQTCRAPILLAFDDEVAALLVRLDPRPLDVAAELAALAAGQLTYELVPWGMAAHVLRHRIPEVIRARHGLPVFATHQCEKS